MGPSTYLYEGINAVVHGISDDNMKALHGLLEDCEAFSRRRTIRVQPDLVYGDVKGIVDEAVEAILSRGEKIPVDFVDQITFTERIKEKEKEEEFHKLMKTTVRSYNRSDVEALIAFGTCDC
jgi:hypothetical protein